MLALILCYTGVHRGKSSRGSSLELQRYLLPVVGRREARKVACILSDDQPSDFQSLGSKDHIAIQSFLGSCGLPGVTCLGPQPRGPSHRLSIQRKIFERVAE
jgi:hypothetical protein